MSKHFQMYVLQHICQIYICGQLFIMFVWTTAIITPVMRPYCLRRFSETVFMVTNWIQRGAIQKSYPWWYQDKRLICHWSDQQWFALHAMVLQTLRMVRRVPQVNLTTIDMTVRDCSSHSTYVLLISYYLGYLLTSLLYSK